MIRTAALLAVLASGAPAFAAGGGPIRSGEHPGFSRLVMRLDPGTAWSAARDGGRVVITFPGSAFDFSTTGVFALIPRTRIENVRSTVGPTGTIVELDLGCDDCRVSAGVVPGPALALDVLDPGTAIALAEALPEGEVVVLQPGDTPSDPATGPAIAPIAEDPADGAVADAEPSRLLGEGDVRSAERALIEQFERAASQGLIQLSDAGLPEPEDDASDAVVVLTPEPTTPDATAPEDAPAAEAPAAVAGAPAPSQPAGGTLPTLPVETLEDQPQPLAVIASLPTHRQIEAKTVFDRDGGGAAPEQTAPPVPSVCLDDARLDVGAWTNGLPLHRQIPDLSRLIVGEFDRPDTRAIADLARLYIRYGFGAEAEGLVRSFDAPFDDQRLLIDLARAVEGRRVTADGPLAETVACPGRHGLWLALGGVAPVYQDAASFDEVAEAFEDLPNDLRLLVGPTLAGRLLDAGHPAEARRIHDIIARPGEAASVDLRLVEGRLAAAEDDPAKAIQLLNALVDDNAYNANEALRHALRIAIDADLAIPDRTVLDLQTAVLEQRGTSSEPVLRALLAEALAQRGDLKGAVQEVVRARADVPAAAASFDAVAASILAAADPDAVGPSAYAETVIANASLIAPDPQYDVTRRGIAVHLLDLGLANAALDVLAPVLERDETEARLLAARAHLRLDEAGAAQQMLEGLTGDEAATLRAQAFALAGDYAQAAATLEAQGLEAGAGAYAWPSGEWAKARQNSEDPRRTAMANYMAARSGSEATPAPAADPAALAPAEAFQEPLPPLDEPSLGAARSLLAAGQQVQDFVKDLLKDDAPEGVAKN